MSNEGVKSNENYGKDILSDYIKILEKECEDFSDVKLCYQNAYKKLKKVFKYTDRLVELHEDKTASTLMFSFELGLSDNLEHFRHPNKKTFMDGDYIDSLKEDEAHRQDDYKTACAEIRQLLDIMPLNAENLYDEMIDYFVFLDTYVPKMAHYYGFITANTVLKRSLNGYKEDTELSNAYKEWLSDYLDLNLNL